MISTLSNCSTVVWQKYMLLSGEKAFSVSSAPLRYQQISTSLQYPPDEDVSKTSVMPGEVYVPSSVSVTTGAGSSVQSSPLSTEDQYGSVPPPYILRVPSSVQTLRSSVAACET